ncbi:MAG TPA: glycosyltransferase [Mycobacterium sp.]|nr:glycosyltransferase [Mycobacterium sp.]
MMPSSAAAVEFAGPRQVRVAAVALPEPGPDEVVVTMHFSGISGGRELLAYRGEIDPGVPLDESLDGTFIYPFRYGDACVGEADGQPVFAFHPHQNQFVARRDGCAEWPPSGPTARRTWIRNRSPPPRPGHAPPRRPGRRRAGLHRAGPGPPRRPWRPGRAPRRARPDGIACLYAGADVFVLPSWREPYGTVYGEALAAGLPVVGWRAGNLPHLVSDGVEGVVLDPGDIPTLAAALDRLASNELWRAAVARAAGRRGAALPRWSHTAATLFAALKELTASAR